jgi:HD-GYP domain-containing protein (c-di-GMP phosphodiesterase class II)
MTENRDLAVKTRELALDFLLRFNIAFKIAKVYEANNRLFLDQIEPLYRSLALIVHAEGEAAFALRQNALYFNQVRMDFDLANYHIFRTLAAEFRGRGIGAVAFHEGVTREEMGRLVVLLANLDMDAPEPFARLRKALEPQLFLHVAIDQMDAVREEIKPELDAAKLFFLGISMLRDIFEKQKRKDPVGLNVLRRWILNLVPLLAENEAYFFGLTGIKNFEGYIPNHGVNTAILSIALGRRLGLSRREILDLGAGALLHDVGKLEAAAGLLDKPSALSADERKSLERQVRLGAQRILPLKPGRRVPTKAFEIAVEHSLRIDLANVPPEARRTSLHLFGRIVKIADAYDALTTRRVYRPAAFAADEALAIIRVKCGEEFDPILFKAFASMLGPYPVGSLAALTTGELAVVLESNPQSAFAARPRVKLITDRDGRRIDGPEADLTDTDPKTRKFKRSIVHSLDPGRYGIRTADYFLRKAR